MLGIVNAVAQNMRSERGLPVVKTVLNVASPKLWSAETPWLYTMKVSSYDKKGKTE